MRTYVLVTDEELMEGLMEGLLECSSIYSCAERKAGICGEVIPGWDRHSPNEAAIRVYVDVPDSGDWLLL